MSVVNLWNIFTFKFVLIKNSITFELVIDDIGLLFNYILNSKIEKNFDDWFYWHRSNLVLTSNELYSNILFSGPEFITIRILFS